MGYIMKVVNTILTGTAILIVGLLMIYLLFLSRVHGADEKVMAQMAAIMAMGMILPMGAMILNIITVFAQDIKTSTKFLNMVMVFAVKTIFKYGMLFYLLKFFSDQPIIMYDQYNMLEGLSSEELSYVVTRMFIYGLIIILQLSVYIVTPFKYKQLQLSENQASGNYIKQNKPEIQAQAKKYGNKSPFEM